MRFHGDDDEVLRSQLARIVGESRMRHQRLPSAAQREAVRLHRGEVGTAGDAAHLDIAGRGQAGGDVASDRSGPEDADSHLSNPSFAASPMRWSFPVGPRGSSLTKTILCGTL